MSQINRCGCGLLLLLSLLVGCKKPAPPVNDNTPTTPATHALFPIATGTHALDCNSCHGGFASFKEFSCVSCHGHDETPTDSIHVGVTGYSYSSAACYSCHPDGSKKAFGTINSDPAANLSLTALIPSYASTFISSVTSQSETLAMSMNHSTTQVAAAAFSSCANCHADAASGVYYPGKLHSSLANLKLAQPTACSDCHRGAAPTGFVGPVATNPARAPATGEMKHDAVAWVNDVPTSTPINTYDCGICHQGPMKTASSTWANSLAGIGPALFHSALTAAGQAQPGSCIDCHANSRPARVLTSANATLPANLQFDHSAVAALGNCAACHATGSSTQWTLWSGGRFHLAGSPSPNSCVSCHAGERPTTTANWGSPTYTATPFDYGTNTNGISHGDGQDCATCHAGAGTGTWGGSQNWMGGHFAHGATTISGTTCIACHTSQRPTTVVSSFDHSQNGTGDCFGCHQATVTSGRYAAPSDWSGGQEYPGSTLVGSPNQFITVTEIGLNRSGPNNLVTSTSSTLATLYNEMLHVSVALPPLLSAGPTGSPDYSKCWHCHTSANGVVSSYKDGQFHPRLTTFTVSPDGGTTLPDGGTQGAFPQPTTQCLDCHTQMRPAGVVEKAASDLQTMDHNAMFTSAVVLGGVSVSGVGGMSCSLCHHSPGNTWSDGVFHANIGGAAPQDCNVCHYPLLADSSNADLSSGVSYKMLHRSSQMAFQNCKNCHGSALSKSTTTPLVPALWVGGSFHPNLGSQPAACAECHAVSEPAAGASTQSSWQYSLTLGGTSSNGAQWMNHGSPSVAGKDCVVCHASDAKTSGSAWSKADSFHSAIANPAVCQSCHGLTNGGGGTPGINNNLPSGVTDSSTLTSASADSTTGIPTGTHDQINHADVNVSAHECNFCHTQLGMSSVAGIQGREWAQASFHNHFNAANPLVLNATSGRCSTCHMNVKPGASFAAQDHRAFTSTSGTEDCSSCHSWPGTGSSANPNWLGAAGMPVYISVGGFTVSQPPATTTVTQPGINNLPHPTVGTGVACTQCHTTSAGGKGAFGYDHASSLMNSNCGSCHEAGSNLVGTPWNGATTRAAAAGDTRPYTLPTVTAQFSGNSRDITYPNHFYIPPSPNAPVPIDCSQCHNKPSGTSFTSTGSAYTSEWSFPHDENKMNNPSTCLTCHPGGPPN